MRKQIERCFLILALAVVLALTALWSPLKGVSTATLPVNMIVSVEAKHGKEVPSISREDVVVFQEGDRVQVKDWVALQADPAGVELFVLIDDSTDTTLGLQLDDLRKFITSQPDMAKIAVGYIRNGDVNIIQNPTNDHALAAKALRLPLGSGAGTASPYTAITDMIKHWPESAAGREILLVSSGIDGLQPGANDTYLDEAIDQAQRAGVQIYSIYGSPSGHAGHSFWRLNWGQSNLSRLTDETGGEAYFQGLEMPISFAPYLEQMNDRFKHQYRLTFLARVGKKAGYQRIRLETEVPNAELVAAARAYIPAQK
jgi:hypothetical protein